jgi:hypothetical protein
MTADDFQQDVPVSQYGAARRQAWLDSLAARAADMEVAAMEAHRADHDVVASGQGGIFGALSGQDQAAMLASRRRVGDGAGAGRDLIPMGGVDFESQGAGAIGPIPRRADLRYAGQPAEPGMSPLKAYLEGRQ